MPSDKGNNAKQNHEYFMELALAEARRAADLDEVPVGAVLVRDGQVVAKGRNLREKLHSVLGHAEIVTLHRASQKLESWRLVGCTLYVTLEPCIMCAGALVQSRVARLVYGATDPKGGGVRSLYQLCEDSRQNHRIEIVTGVLEQPCGDLLREFFRKKRQDRKSGPS